MLPDRFVKKSPPPLSQHKRHSENEQQQKKQQQLFANPYSLGQESSFISSSNNHNHNNNKRYRPTETQSLTRATDFHHNRQYPTKLQIFQPSVTNNKEQQKQNKTTTCYEYEYELEKRRRSSSENNNQQYRNDLNIHRESLDCLNDLTDEYKILPRENNSLNNQKNKTIYETKQQDQHSEGVYRCLPKSVSRTEDQTTYQHSLSENLLYKQLKPLVKTVLTLSVDNIKTLDYSLQHQQRLVKPIHIHSSTNSVPDETSIKYVRAERLPVEAVLSKSQITKTQGGHSSTVVKDVRYACREVTTNIHQPLRRRTIEGQHELRVFDKPITSGTIQPVESTIFKPIETLPMKHSSINITRSARGDRFHTVDIGSTLTHQRTQSGPYDLRNRFGSIQSNLSKKSVEFSLPTSTHHSSTIVKLNRTPASSVFLDKVQTQIKGQREVRFADQPIQPGSAKTVESIVPKSIMKQVEHTTTIVTEKQPSRRVLEITGSGKKTKADMMQLLIEKPTLPAEHSSTIIKGQPQSFTIGQTQPILGQHAVNYYDRPIESYDEMEGLFSKQNIVQHSQEGEHQVTYIKQTRPKYEPVELAFKRPVILPSVSKLIADIPASTQITSIKPTEILLTEDNSYKQDREINNVTRYQQFDEMELILDKPYVYDSSVTLIANIQPDFELKSIQQKINKDEESKEFHQHKSYIEENIQSESIFQRPLKGTPLMQQPIEESSTNLTMKLNTDQQIKPFELILPRLDIESSASTIAGLHTKIDVPSNIERSSFNGLIERKKLTDDEIELIVPKPKYIDKSTSTLIADVQAQLETKEIRPNEIQPEISSATVFFDETTEYIIPESVEIRMKQPIVQNSSTTLLANAQSALDPRTIQIQTNTNQSLEQSASAVSFEIRFQQNQLSEVELVLPRPPIQESISVMLTDIHSTLDTSQKHIIIPPPPQHPIESSSQFILEQGIESQQEQSYGLPTIHADLNQPVEFVFNVEDGNASTISQQYRQDYNTRMLTSATNGTDKMLSLGTENSARQFKPIEFVVSGGLSGFNNSIENYATVGDGSYTTTTTTKRTITSSDTGGYSETTNRSVIRGIRPYDQVDLVLQPDSSLSSISKVLTTKVGLDSNHAPYFSLSLHDQTAREGESVLFEVVVSAQPSAEIVWDKDGTLIGDDSAFRLDYYGDGRTTLYIPEAFFDDQGNYTCTATNSLGTCRTTARLTVDSTGEGSAPKRRHMNDSSVVYYEQGPRQTFESYHLYSQPSRTITQVTEETEIYQIPSEQQHNEKKYSIYGSQPKFQPVSFLVSSTPENQQQQRNSGLVATVAKQAGPTYSQYQQYVSHEPEHMQTESTTSMIRYAYSHEQPTSTSYITTKPNFTKPLEPIDALEGGTIQITVHLTSSGPQHSRPQIQWYHHSQPIVPDNIHYRIIDEHDTSTLEIINITRGDTGQVWCVATTPAGSATTTCDINVAENPARTHHHLRTSHQVVPQETVYKTQATHLSHAQIPLHHQQYEQQQQQQQQRVPSHFYTTQTITQQQTFPQLYTPLSSQTSHSYASPASSLQSQYVTSQNVTPQSFVPQAPPLLPNYTSRANYSDQHPKIINGGLKDQPLYVGSDTVFECQFTGHPDKIQWFHNDVEILYNSQQLNNRVYHITNPTNGTSRLIIRSTTNEDVGTYTVKISGPNGEEISSAKLIPATQFENMQKKKVELTQRKALVHELEEKQIKRMRPSRSVGPRSSFTSYGTSDDDVFYEPTQRAAAPSRQLTAPTLSRPLQDSNVKEGQPIILTCQVQGFPKSELFWFKNNAPLPLSARHKIAYDAGSGTITLRINDSRPEDSGTYAIVAKNPQGHVQTNAYIDVEQTPAIDETSYVQPDAFKYIEKQPTGPRPFKGHRDSDTSNLQQKPAKILKTPMNTSILEGGTVQFSCQVEGSPKPKIVWLKDNKPLMAGKRFSTYFDQTTKTSVLRITDVCKDDQGYYTCIVDNPLNSDQSTATLQVIPESKIDQRSYVETDAFKYLTPENKQPIAYNKDYDRSGVESEYFVNPDAFRYLEAKKPSKQNDDNLTIDDRPIVDVDAFRYLEARQAAKVKKDVDVRASIDDTPLVAPDAFRYLERKVDAARLKKDQDTGPAVDETPQVDLNAFLYLERKGIPQNFQRPESSVDESSISNPSAFIYLERKPTKKPDDNGPTVDETPIVNPDAFRYLERKVVPQARDTTPNVDTTPIVNPEVFRYLERPNLPNRVDEGPTVDNRPIVPQEAFRWLERPKPVQRAPEGPSVDESTYVNPLAFRYIEAKPKKIIDQGPKVDESSYVNPQAFIYLEAPILKTKTNEGPAIDTSTYVNPELFVQFDQKPAAQPKQEEQEIKRSPRVIQPLRNTQIHEGKPIALVAIIDGYPTPQLTWLKDGAELPASTRVTTNYDISSKTAWVRIDSARPDDSAVYTVIAHNPAGDVRSDARLNVVPSMTPIDDTAFVPAAAFSKIERPTSQNRSNVPETTGVDDTSFINPELFRQFEVSLKQPEYYTDEVIVQVPARILAPLKSVHAPESVTVVLEAIVDGTPIPTFTWLKDQLPLSDSNRFVINYDLPSKRVTLTIKDVRESDAGTYTLLASNGPQLHNTSAKLQILGAPSVDQSSFISIDAFKQLEQPLKQPHRIQVQPGVDQTSYVSQPDRFAVFDQIQPNRRPLNEFGGVDETPLVNLEKIHLLETPSKQNKQPYDIEEKSQAPSVLAPIRSINAPESTHVVLTAKIDGSPIPTFTWFKDNAPLVASSRFTTHYDILTKLIMLQINDARPNDTGVYTVRADNPSGNVSTSATLNISSLPSVRDQAFISADKFDRLEQSNQPRFIEGFSGVDDRALVDLTRLQQLEIKPNRIIPEEEHAEQCRPTVLVPLRHVHAVENQPVVLSAQIQGKPQPQFTWYKNNQPLSEGNRFRTHYDMPSKTIFLTMADARDDDTGVYRLVAQNPLGQDETSCMVNVDLNQPLIDRRSFVPQTAFEQLEKPTYRINDVQSGVDQTSFFDQELFRPFDEHHIKHPSAIVGGEESDAVMPITAPKVVTPLRPVTMPEGETVVLTTQVEGYPLPQFTWMLNNQPLMASNRVTSHYDMLTKRCFLQLIDSRPNDSGTYELVAENPAGQDRTKTELTVVPVSKIDQTGYVPYDKFSTLEFKPRIPSDLRSGVDATPFVSGEIFRLLETKPVNQQHVPENEQSLPLEVIIPLKLAVAQEGQPVILTTKIRGRPVPQFTWLRNNQPLMESTRFQTQYDFPSETLVLEISDIWPHDSGTYTVIAQNPRTGERVETSAPLVVRSDTTPVDHTAFVAPDAFRTLESGPNLRTVFVEPGVDTNSFLSPDALKALDQGKPKPTGEQEKEQPRTPPKVIIPLKPINCNEGQPINFTAKVEGNPHPTFTWFKNNQPLQESNRLWSHYDVPSKTVLLQVNGARPDDSGTYTLVAKNPLGQDQTQTPVNVSFGPAIDTNAFVSPEKFAAFDQPFGLRAPLQSGVDTTPFVQPERFAQLEVKAPVPTKEDLEHMEAPRVITPLQSVQVKEGSPVLLQATIIGKPRPNFVWLKDGQPLPTSTRLRTRYDIGTKQVLLQINDVRPHDIGEYVVIATNPAGEDSSVCSLSVQPDKPGVDDRAFVPEDKFRNLEHPEGKGRRPLEIVPGVDTQPFVSPDKFRNLDHIPTSMKPEDVPLEARRPPRVITPLSNCELEELMPVLLTTTIDAGVPMATFTWYKNGEPLLEGNRFTTKYDIYPKTLTLQVLAARPDDDGTYTVRVTNPSGSDETTCKLAIRPVASIDTTPFVKPERFAQLELKAPLPTSEDLQQMEPPKVIVPLQDVQINEESPVLLQATVIGKPTPHFIWLKDGAPLPASNRLRTRYDIGTKQVLLQINDARPQDIGEYVVIATNPVGEDSSVCSLNVVPDKPGVDDRAFVPQDKFRDLEHPEGKDRRPITIVPGVDTQPFVSPDKFRSLDHVPTSMKPEDTPLEAKRPPRVLVPLSNCELEELMPAILTTTIDAGVPMATFTWYKNGQPLLEGNRFTTKYDIYTKTLTLQVLAARPDDQGTYTVRATNPVGSDETTCKLAIRPTPSIDTTPFIQPEFFTQLELKAPPLTKEDFDQMEPPKVIVPLQSLQVTDGSPVLLKATVIGKPTPHFIWLKDGAPLPASNRLRTRYDIGTKQVLLQINDVRPHDIGEYVVIATNPAGEDSSVCSLSVVPDKPGVDDRAFVPEDKFRDLEHPEGKRRRPLEIVPGVDTQPFVSPDKFRNLDHVPTSIKPEDIPLEARRPPRVIVPLRNCELEELMPVILTTTIDAGVPMAAFTWYKDGQPLYEGNRFTTKYDIYTKTLTLQVLAARPDDQGTYTVRATNPVGSDETTCNLTIHPTASIDTRPFIQPDRFAPLEVKAPLPTKEDLDKMEPPKVIVPLENLQVPEGSPVLLKATIIGKPTPNFVWLKDGAPLPASNRLRTRYDIGTKQVLLQVNDIRPQDIGEYVVIATNPAGEDSTRCSLNVVPDKPGVDDRAFLPEDKFRDLEHPQGKGRRPIAIVPGVDTQPFVSPDKFRNLDHVPSSVKPEEVPIEAMRPPHVIVPLSNCEIEELMPVLLTTTIDAGVPMASFTWYKNGQPLYEGNRFTTKYDIYTKTLTLQVLAARPDDQGTYTVRAINPVGSDETTCDLTVRPTASIDTRPFIQPDRFAPLEVKAPPPTKEDLDKMEPPKVIVPLENLQVTEGSPVLLKATIIGKPTPNFVWLKDGAPLPASNRLRTRYDIGTKQVLLQVNDIRPQDIGEYVVIATNPAGEDSTRCSLNVVPDKPGVDDRAFVPQDKFRDLEHPQGKGRRPIAIVPGVDTQPFVSPDKFRNLDHVPSSVKPEEVPIEAMRPPHVIVPLSNCEIEELMPVLLTTTIDAGVPMASFTWYKNGQPLLEGNRFTTKYDIYSKVLTLQILAARPDDQGTYTVQATNPAGSDETTCTLTIRPVASIDTSPFIQPDRFAPLEVKAPPPTKEDMDKMEPPKVIVPLQSQQVTEGSPVLLQATITGRPTPDFVWLKDGAPLPASNRLRTRYDIGTKQVLLQINDIRPQDIGEYVVIATNPAGEDSTVCSLSVVPDKPGVDDRAFVPQDKFRDLEHPQGKGRRPIAIVPGVDTQPFVSPDKFRNLNHVPPSIRPEEELAPEVMRPPRVIVPLSNCELEELMPVILTATIDPGVPMASFTWHKNGQPLLEGNRFTTNYDIVNRTITLQILASRPDDQGVYTVRATNPVGSDETTCKLTIRPVASIDTRPFVDAARFRPLENRPGTAQNVDDENQLLRPPKVLVPMNNVRLTESQPIILKSIVDAGYPMGKFTWLKDNRPLAESNRYRANFDINTRTASLFIDSARPSTDTGRYTVHVENIVGKDQTTGEVNIEGTPGVDDRPFVEPSKFGKFEGPQRSPGISPRGPILQPDDSLKNRENLTPWIRLVKELEDQVIDEAKAAQLFCSVDAHPGATIMWLKDGRPLMVSQRFTPEYDFKTGIVRLTIYPVYAADSGEYTMVARNIAGEVSTKCKLKIQPTANVEEHPLAKFAGLRKIPQQPSNLATEPSLKPVDSTDGQPPYFIKIPVDQEVPEGQLVRLYYVPAGRPEPSLTWYRNGQPLRPDDADHCDVVNEGGVHSLLIRNPKLGPPVEYTCVAKNKFGEASFPVHLKVVERGSNIAPFFIEQLYDITIIEGQDAPLDACAQGFPEPKVTWEKEGRPLTPNKEYKVEYEGAKTTLYIREAKMTDAGWYQCTATSPAGTAITKCRVTVIPLSEAGKYAADLPQLGPQSLAKLPVLPEEDIRSKYMTVPVKPPEVKPEELYKLPRRSKKLDNPAEEARKRGVKVLPDEVLAALQKNLEEYPEEEMYSKDRPQPPKFKVHIKSQLNLNEDDPSMFEAKLIPVRDPMMRVQWFKNGKILHHASRIVPRYDFADVSLEFLWTFAEDDGIYECVATNPYGEDRTRAELKCRPKRSIIYNTQLPEGMEGVSKLQMLEDEIRYTSNMIGLEEKVEEKEPKAPEIIMPLEDLTVDEGDNAKFIVKIDGHPRPRLTWTINNADIANGSRYKLIYDGLVHYLDIPKTRQYDAGTVCCTAKNSLGQAESVATLNLRFRQDYRSALSKTPGGIDTGLEDSFDLDIEERLRVRSQVRQKESADDRMRRPSADKLLHPLHSKAADRMAWRQTVEKTGDAPNFTKPLLPLKVKEGSKVVVSVEFTGDPAPTVSWYRDSFMVEDSEDFKIHTTATQSTLTIKHAFIIDSGLYTIKLFNPIGIRQCQAAMRIVPIIAEDQTPRFLDVPNDTEILAGDPGRFQCRVEGQPFPTVSFYREDEPVNLNDKRFRVIQENDVFTLLIFEALPADSGQYEAVAGNTVGKANTRFTLTVTPRGSGGKKASLIDDPKLIHKVPYLEKPLEDLHVKEGQSATFECIIPASFGSDVKWYKGTSEWAIKPSKFFKPKSDGTKHQLFILEAYAEDAGLYKCVVSNPVGTTASTATLKVDHTMQVPEFVRGFSNLTTYEGEPVRFEVEVRGDPAPALSWYRGGELIRDSPDFQIFTEGNRSLLYISEVFMEDQGLFTCTASNAAGSSDCSARLIVEPRPQL
ncbi:unnamed protein product [Rotaria socialis]